MTSLRPNGAVAGRSIVSSRSTTEADKAAAATSTSGSADDEHEPMARVIITPQRRDTANFDFAGSPEAPSEPRLGGWRRYLSEFFKTMQLSSSNQEGPQPMILDLGYPRGRRAGRGRRQGTQKEISECNGATAMSTLGLHRRNDATDGFR